MHKLGLIPVLGSLALSTASFAMDLKMPMQPRGTMSPPQAPAKVVDQRTVIVLTEDERAEVMVEMRQMLASVQGIADGLARNDRRAVADAAGRSGMAMMQGVSMPVRMKFPQPFRDLAMSSHGKFDDMARGAETAAPEAILKQLGEAMQACVACHATYRFALAR